MNQEEVLLTVIVPIYNMEGYLRQCLDSLSNQSQKNMQILLIDDGSVDGSARICDEYQKKDPRMQAFHKKNGGLHDAENFGLEKAEGTYIAFVDADDYLPHRESLEKLVQKAEETKADIVAGNYYKDMDGDLVEANEHGFKDHESTRTVDFRFRAFYSVGHLAYTWGKVYRTEFLKKNNLLMKPYRYSLDKLFNVECYLCAPVYAFVKDRVYVYRYNLSSISHQYKKGFREMWIAITKEMHQTMSAMSKGFAYFDLLAFNLFFAVFFSAKQEYTASGKSVKTVYKELEAYGQDPFVKSFMIHLAKGKYVRDIESFLWKTMIRVFSVGFRLKWYKLLAFGVKVLIDFNIDGRLSSTGNYYKQKH